VDPNPFPWERLERFNTRNDFLYGKILKGAWDILTGKRPTIAGEKQKRFSPEAHRKYQQALKKIKEGLDELGAICQDCSLPPPPFLHALIDPGVSGSEDPAAETAAWAALPELLAGEIPRNNLRERENEAILGCAIAYVRGMGRIPGVATTYNEDTGTSFSALLHVFFGVDRMTETQKATFFQSARRVVRTRRSDLSEILHTLP